MLDDDTNPTGPDDTAPTDDQNGQPNGTDAAQDAGKDAAKPDPKPADQPDWKARARQHEDGAKAARQERDQAKARLDAVLKALDPDSKGDEDPAKAAEKALSERDQAAAELKAERLERAAERAARTGGVDEVALLDSRGFLERLAKLDPTGDSFADDLKAAVNAAVGANPALKATSAPPASATADLNGGSSSGSGQLKRADLKNMTPKQIEDARKAGKLDHLLGG